VNLAIGEEATTDQKGLFKVGDQYHVRMDGQTYRTWFDESTGKWRLRHPSRAHAYAPMLEHNAAGAWRAALDNPLQWQGNPYLFRRLGVGFATLSDESIERILAVTGMDEAALRRIHFDNAKPSGHLLDTVARFQLDRDLARFIQHLNTADPASNLESTLAGLRKDSALSRLWDVLDAQQRSALADEGAEWTQSLTAQQIAERANAQRTYLFDTFYSAGNRPTPDPEATVCRDFPGLPLPVVKQLIENATDAERIRLTAELRLPLRMAEEAREHLREVRLNRANEGFYLDSVSNRDTDTLTLHFLEHLGEVDNADERRLALATLATGQRRESARALGQAPTPSWFNPPQRLGANRVGYPLSGRGDPASGRAHINGLFRSLYPDFSNEQIEEQLGWWRASGTNSWQALQLLERQFSSFDNALSRWEYEPIASTSSRRRPERVQVANVLRRCWRRQTAAIEAPNGRILGYRLNLEGSRIGQFPKLPEDVDLSHIVDLNLHGMQLAQVPEDFLRLFTGVRWLDISNNQLTHLPAVSGRMSQLRALNLQGNQIRLSTADTATLGQLLRLEELNLSSNPVGEVPDVSRLRRLQVLRLRNTGIDRLPDGLLGRRLPVSVDLRENRIHDLPDALLSSETHLMQHIIVHDNPLSESTLTRLRAFRQRSAMGQEIHAHNASPAAAARALWLPARDNPQWLHRRQCWDRVSAEPAAQDFIRLLVDLSETSDFQHAREDLTRRVWEVLDGAYQNTDLRKELFELAANPRSCSDSILVNFSALEVRTFVFNTRSNARSSQDSSGLLTLARGLFRLEQLERLAREHIAALPAIAGVPPVDEIEVDLAYRTGLADRLELPGQPRTMSFELIAGVTPADLDTAAAQVLAAENTSQLQTFIAERDFWIDFLKKKYVEELEKVELPFREREDALIEQQTELTSAVYEQRYLALAEERNAAVAELITRLTAREQAPVTVALPETDEPAQTPAGSGGK
jgi:hypothetical protein